MDDHRAIWDRLFRNGEFLWLEPHERLPTLIPRLRRGGVDRVLDLGCGRGRHLVFLESEGFRAYGVDISIDGLRLARPWLEAEGFCSRLAQSKMARLPFGSGSFGFVICVYVIYHASLDQLREALQEVERVLLPGGLALLNFLAQEHYRFGKGTRIEQGTFIPDEGADAGILHHYTSQAELESLLSGFKDPEMDFSERIDEDGQRHGHWTVLVRK